ncbi:2-hydroxychromene-2-carboxylate isomerase [Chelatococcus sp. SYSU_G07232]|uniref:2-hydroxychromene-2-carboxylate isomerase n=1 Tax=Chelatococcus albus TaxID=3047466 RepID=A0ABT7AFU9_9HYPH|nr:2-hydroxychromene-2-carboxylate isomerase [Chelatococcus sp. SYSU_G07232]MDJ1157975.1 2-hydroxychromene-2-carboxylate isomerase [Chelatococcus sp. SYSU_G07232]
MARTVDYYFSLASPWAYIGHGPFMDIVARHGLKVNYKPVFLGQVFAETGGLPLPKRHPARQKYRFVELQRWREKRGLNFHLRPKFWPFDVNLVDRFVIAIVAAGLDPDAFLRRAFAAVWEKERNLADEGVVAAIARDADLDPTPLLLEAKGDATEALYEQNFKDAVAADVFGSPSYVVDGEIFWGQDRLELLDDMLTSGRAVYSPLV